MTQSPYCPHSEIEAMHGSVTERRNQVSPANVMGVETTADHNKLLGLEILRFVAAVAVLVFHYQHFVFQGVSQPAEFVRAHQPLYPVLQLLYEQGFEGVRVFWCISGFIFFWRYRESIADGRVGGRKFFVLRFSRLYPLHFATLLLVALLQLIYIRSNTTSFVYPYNDLRHFILQLFMASNWGLQKGDSFNGPIWSISLEVLVYGVFYLVLAFVSKSWLVNITVLALCGVARILGIHHPILDCLVFFYVGGLSAIAYRAPASPSLRSIATGIAVFLSCAALPLVWVFRLYHHGGFSFVFLVCYTPVLLFCLCADFKVGPVARSCIEAAGNMTYASYLLHFPLQLALVILFSALGASLPFYSTVFFCLFLTGTLLASYFVYKYLEFPGAAGAAFATEVNKDAERVLVEARGSTATPEGRRSSFQTECQPSQRGWAFGAAFNIVLAHFLYEFAGQSRGVRRRHWAERGEYRRSDHQGNPDHSKLLSNCDSMVPYAFFCEVH